MNQRDEKLRNLVLLGSIFALVGLGLSIYSLFHHLELKQLGQTSFSCNINDTFSCDDIANSKYAEDMWGNPMGVYGIGYFLGLFALLITARVKESLRKETLQAYSVLVVIGALVSIVLFCISEFIIGKICPTCVGIYFVTFVQAGVLFFSRDAVPKPFSMKSTVNGGWYAVVALGVALAGFQAIKPRAPCNLTLDNPKTGAEVAEVRKQIAEQSLAKPSPLANLAEAVSPSVQLDLNAYSGLGEDFHKGSPDAKVKVVEFVDFQCPACGAMSKTLRKLHSEFGDRVLFAFKNFPLDQSCNVSVQSKMHPHACSAAKLSRCAGANGKFWELHNQLFDNQPDINEKNVLAWAKEYGGLSDTQIKECLESKDVAAKINDDVRQANEAGLQGTPTLFINGRKYDGSNDINELRSIIENLL